MSKSNTQTGTTNQTSTNTQSQTGESTNFIDQASQDFITDFLRPLGEQSVTQILEGGPIAVGPTETFQSGVDATQNSINALDPILQSLQGLQGVDFNSALQSFQPNVGETGFTPTGIDTNAGLDLFNQFASGLSEQFSNPGDVGVNFSAAAFDPSSISQFLSPFEDEVVSSVQANADRQRELALTRAAQEATAQGAFGGSRSGILQAETLRNVNQDEAAQIADLRNTGFQNAANQALSAFQSQQGNALNAAIADAQNRVTSQGQTGNQLLSLLGSGLQAAGLDQQGQIAQGQLGLNTAIADQSGRQADANLALSRAQGLQAGEIASGAQDLSAIGLGLQGINQQGALGGQLANLGEVERQALNDVAQEELVRLQAAMGLAQDSFGGPLGSTSTTNSTSTGTSTSQGTTSQTQEGNLFQDLLGAGLTLGGLFTGGGTAALPALSSSVLQIPQTNSPVPVPFQQQFGAGQFPVLIGG